MKTRYSVVRDNIQPDLVCASRREAEMLAKAACENGHSWAAVYADDASEPICKYKRNPNSTGPRVYRATV